VKKLRPYQEDAVRVLAGGGLNASGLGAGKTLTSVEACRLLRNLGRPPRILVIAPVNTLRQWEATFNEQFPSLAESGLTRVVGTHRKDEENWLLMTRKRPGVYIIGWNAMHGGIPEQTRRMSSKGRNAISKDPKATMASAKKAMQKGTVPPWTRTGTWDLMIADECHRAVNRTGVPRQVIKCIKADRKILLSATPGGNKRQGLWTILNILWPDRYPSFWDWAERYFEIEETQVSRDGKTVKEIGPEKFPGAAWTGIPAVVRHQTPNDQEVIERVVRVPMEGGQAEQYRDFERQSLAWVTDHPVAAQIPLEQRTRLRQVALGTLKAEEAVGRINYKLNRSEQGILDAWQEYCAEHAGASREDFLVIRNAGLKTGALHLDSAVLHRILEKQAKLDQGIEFEEIELPLDISYDDGAPQPKLDAVREILADLPEDETLLVWTHSAKWARMAEAKLGAGAVSWTMRTTAARRKKIEAGFGTEYRVLIAQLQSLSEGVDWLKDVCHCEVIASPTEDNVMNEQAEGRLHRPGQKNPVQRWRLVSDGTIDDDVNLKNLAKRSVMASLYKDGKEKETE